MRSNKCDGCNQELQHHEHVTVLIPDVEVSTRSGTLHFKLSCSSLDTRVLQVYCSNCINPKKYYANI